jgi:hypothetical protein
MPRSLGNFLEISNNYFVIKTSPKNYFLIKCKLKHNCKVPEFLNYNQSVISKLCKFYKCKYWSSSSDFRTLVFSRNTAKRKKIYWFRVRSSSSSSSLYVCCCVLRHLQRLRRELRDHTMKALRFPHSSCVSSTELILNLDQLCTVGCLYWSQPPELQEQVKNVVGTTK